MVEIGARQRNQPAPPHILFEALTEPYRPGARAWLELLPDEQPPTILETAPPHLVVWSSLWPRRADAVIRFELPGDSRGTDLRWVLTVEEPAPDASLTGHLRKRINTLINGSLRLSFGQ